jgi:DNA-binding response OmpR family regulator
MLSARVNEVVPREHALKQIWGSDTYFNGRSMDVFISKLRKMLSADGNVEIMNVHGKGFKLVVKTE